MLRFYDEIMEEFEKSPDAAESLLLELDTAKSAGPNGIHPHIFKQIAFEINRPQSSYLISR